MRILITLAHLGLGGTETYSVTVAEQLERLGHPTRLHSARTSPQGRELVASHGLRLSVGDEALADLDAVDAVLAQDSGSAYLLAHRARLRQIFVVHGLAPFEHPPALDGPGPEVVALNDRILTRVRALASSPRVVRMHQPIDIERFHPRAASRPRARRLLVLSNTIPADRLRLLEAACADLGLELARVGGEGRGSIAPEEAIAAADIVVGYGRSVLEGMAMGKAAYVWERGGGDGWVTPDTYPALEADGFSGAATDDLIDGERLRADLAAYTPELGACGYDLVRMHHSATKHAEAFVRLLGGEEEVPERPSPAPPADGDLLETLALAVRAEARAANRANGIELEIGRLREAFEAERAARLEAETQLAAERSGRLAAETQLASLVRSRSWRLTSPLRRLRARLRGG